VVISQGLRSFSGCSTVISLNDAASNYQELISTVYRLERQIASMSAKAAANVEVTDHTFLSKCGFRLYSAEEKD
jgi:outer membrane murein-binding lipoprotein Lpp